jgi:hypothetical protein
MATLTAHPAASLGAMSAACFLAAWACLSAAPFAAAVTPAVDQVLLVLSLILACTLLSGSVLAALGEA